MYILYNMHITQFCSTNVEGVVIGDRHILWTETTPPHGFLAVFGTMESERYQDGWKRILQASRSSLNLPQPREKTKPMF